MKFARLTVRLEERKVVGRLGIDFFALFGAISCVLTFSMSPSCVRVMGTCPALALIGYAKQAMHVGEEKNGLAETRPATPALQMEY